MALKKSLLRQGLTAAALVVSLRQSAQPLQKVTTPLPPRLENYVTSVARLSASERKNLAAGLPVARLLDSDASKEIAVLGAIWVDALPSRYVKALQDIERFESGGGFKVTKRISSPPKLEDFDQLHLPKEDVADLKFCRVDKCKLKLSQSGIETLRSEVDWTKPDVEPAVEAAFRQLAYVYLTRYIARGNEGLPVYRDSERPIFVATEFESMVNRMPELTSNLPEIRHYLLEYPDAALPNSSEFFYWQETRFGLKPTIRINHVVIRENPEATIVASKMLYASHYFWTALELRAIVTDTSRGPGFWFITVNRSRSDGLGGLLGPIVRARVRGKVRKSLVTSLAAMKKRLEAPEP